MWTPKEHDLVILTEPCSVDMGVLTKIGTKGTIVSVLQGAYYVEIADGEFEGEIAVALATQMVLDGSKNDKHTNL